MSQINIVTAQNVVLKIELANIGDRILAIILDFLIKAGITVTAVLLVRLTGSNTFVSFILGVLLVLTWVFYSLLFEQFMGGQTPGKRIMKIRVAMLDGSPLTFGSVLLRWLLRLADYTMYIGLWLIVITEKHQRVGDLAGGTILVSTKERNELTDTFNTELEPGYVPVFREADRLSAHDAEILNEVLVQYRENDKYDLVTLAAGKIKSVLQVSTYKDDLSFLKTILKDYNYLTSHEVKPGEEPGSFSVSV